jgi:hypothetical protein
MKQETFIKMVLDSWNARLNKLDKNIYSICICAAIECNK